MIFCRVLAGFQYDRGTGVNEPFIPEEVRDDRARQPTRVCCMHDESDGTESTTVVHPVCTSLGVWTSLP